jgi:outer membrane protein assembly factor BamB
MNHLKALLVFPALFSISCICSWPDNKEEVEPDSLLWRYEAESWIPSECMPSVAKDGSVYFGTDSGYIHALKPDGSRMWTYKAGKSVSSSVVLGEDGSVYFHSADGCFYALSREGKLEWRFESRGRPVSSPAVDEGGRIWLVEEEPTDTVWEVYVSGRGEGEFYVNHIYHLVILEKDGTLSARLGSWDNPLTSPVIGGDGTVYFGSLVYLYAMNPDGSLKWRFPTKGWVRASPAVDGDGVLYFGSEDKNLYAVHPDGTLKWKFETGGNVASTPVIGKDGSVYFGSNDGYFYALSREGGMEWKYKTGGYENGSALVSSDDLIYFHSYGGIFYAFNPDGTARWKTPTGWLRVTSPVMGPHGTVIFGGSLPLSNSGKFRLRRSKKGYFYALKTESESPANSPWPVSRGDGANSGRTRF